MPIPDSIAISKPGYTYKGKMNGRRYYLSTVSVNWTTAKTNCESIAAHLVTIESAAENDSVNLWISSDSWIGATDQASEGTWLMVNGQPQSYTNWAAGEPNNGGGNENYAMMYKAGGNAKKWNDANNVTVLPYMCEIDSLEYVYQYAKSVYSDTLNDTIIMAYRGDTITLTVYPVSNDSDFTYQWQKDGANIIGANQQSYRFKSFDVEDVNFNTNEAIYAAQIKNKCGYVMSRRFIVRYAGCH